MALHARARVHLLDEGVLTQELEAVGFVIEEAGSYELPWDPTTGLLSHHREECFVSCVFSRADDTIGSLPCRAFAPCSRRPGAAEHRSGT